jgi:hypothetical protein
MASFSKSTRGLLLHLDESEVPILRQTAAEILEMITDRRSGSAGDDPLARMVGISTNDQLPENPVLARLFPDAYEDDQSAREFRRYTESSLHEKKEQAIVRLLSSLPGIGEADIDLDLAGIDEWMRAINDLRLALGVVLEIDEDYDARFADVSENDPLFITVHVFYWLGWLQQNLIEYALG